MSIKYKQWDINANWIASRYCQEIAYVHLTKHYLIDNDKIWSYN